MQFCTSLQITTPAPHHSEFLQAGCHSCHPTNSVKALKAELKGHRYFFCDDGMWIMPDMLCMKFPFFTLVNRSGRQLKTRPAVMKNGKLNHILYVQVTPEP